MPKKNTVGFIFALVDVAIGAAALLFFALGSLFLSHIKPLEPLSASFLISLALPAFVLLAGISNLRRSSFSYVVTFFVSFLAGINSLTGIMSPAPPYFLAANASPSLVFLFHYVVPWAAIAYFAAHSFASFIIMRKNKTGEEPAPAAPLPPRAEIFCAKCQASVKETDEVCPSCGELLSGWHCPECGYEGKKSDFRDDRCPRCGKAMTTESEK
jgi:hypothetical protein